MIAIVQKVHTSFCGVLFACFWPVSRTWHCPIEVWPLNKWLWLNLIPQWQDTADAEIRSGRSPGCWESRVVKGSGVCQSIALHAWPAARICTRSYLLLVLSSRFLIRPVRWFWRVGGRMFGTEWDCGSAAVQCASGLQFGRERACAVGQCNATRRSVYGRPCEFPLW